MFLDSAPYCQFTAWHFLVICHGATTECPIAERSFERQRFSRAFYDAFYLGHIFLLPTSVRMHVSVFLSAHPGLALGGSTFVSARLSSLLWACLDIFRDFPFSLFCTLTSCCHHLCILHAPSRSPAKVRTSHLPVHFT